MFHSSENDWARGASRRPVFSKPCCCSPISFDVNPSIVQGMSLLLFLYCWSRISCRWERRQRERLSCLSVSKCRSLRSGINMCKTSLHFFIVGRDRWPMTHDLAPLGLVGFASSPACLPPWPVGRSVATLRGFPLFSCRARSC